MANDMKNIQPKTGKGESMVIFTQTDDLLTWLLPRCESFPKSHRFGVIQRLQDAALDFQETLFLANAHSSEQRWDDLKTADAHLNKLRLYLKFAHQWHWLSSGQFQHVSQMVTLIGKLLGGWLRQTKGGAGMAGRAVRN